jgi:tetratricopeptide (TPR) repeat protein
LAYDSRQTVSTLEGFDPIPLDDAVAMLADESKMEGELAEIAGMLDAEPPVLKWAASLAKTLGWGPLRTRIVSWSSLAKAPWHDDIGRVVAALGADDANLLATLAACDAPFAWDVLEAVVPDVSIEGVCRLEDAKLLRRTTRAGVVTFLVPYAVRAFHRAKASLSEAADKWLDAWAQRAEALRATSYGPSSRATLTELGAAVPLAARALFNEASAAKGLALWTAASDAMFFGDATSFDAPAFLRAVEVADAAQAIEPRVRARLVAGRAMLERGDPSRAAQLTKEARDLADREELRADALRGMGWAALALTNLEAAKAAFSEARTLAEGEPRGQADATAGLGILALMSGDPNAARALLAEALAIHVVMRDAPRESAVRGMMELLPSEGTADVATLASQVDELRAKGQRWREALALARLALDARARGDAETERTRLLEARAAASLSSMPASKLVRSLVEKQGEPAKTFVVANEGRALTLPSGETHDLARHGPVRRILWALAVLRRDKPGAAMSTLDMIEAGWPGEKMQHEAATLRVYTTIRRLRGLGLGDALVTRDEGYLLDPEVAVRTD